MAIHSPLQLGDGESVRGARKFDDRLFRGHELLGHTQKLAKIDLARDDDNAMFVGVQKLALIYHQTADLDQPADLDEADIGVADDRDSGKDTIATTTPAAP